MRNLILFGKPGAGKGTQARFLEDKYDLVHISTGDVFRFNIQTGTPLGKEAKTYMDKGYLVPDDLTVSMLQDEMQKHPSPNGFIFDGFPRTVAQAEVLDAFLEKNGMSISGVVALEADDGVLIHRLLERGKDSGRADDQDENKIRNRFDEYNSKTAPLVEFYRAQNKLYSVNGIGDVGEVTRRLSDVIDCLQG